MALTLIEKPGNLGLALIETPDIPCLSLIETPGNLSLSLIKLDGVGPVDNKHIYIYIFFLLKKKLHVTPNT